MKRETEHDDDLHRTPRRLLNVFSIVSKAPDFEHRQGPKAGRQARHGTAPVIEMYNRGRGQIIAFITRVSDPLTVIGIDMVEKTDVEVSYFFYDCERHHARRAGHQTGDERLGHVAAQVQ